MLETEIKQLLLRIQNRQCEEQTIEIKAAYNGCPERLYDTFSSFSNQDDGGILVFGLDEKQKFAKVGVYNAQDLQKKLMEVGEAMTPVVRPILSVYDEDNKVFVIAEIPPIDLAERPCFKTAKGRIKGSYIRIGESDKPMTEYEIYSYEAYRKKYRDDIRPIDEVTISAFDPIQLEQYLLKRKENRPNLAALNQAQLYELTGITRNEQPTLAALLILGLYPQAAFPQLSIIASRVPGTEIGQVGLSGQRFIDSKRIEGRLPEMLEGAMEFFRSNIRTEVQIDPSTGKRMDKTEYPITALRETVLNALIHRDYSIYTQNMPIQITMFSDRVEISNPGGLYGRLTIDQLGKTQPDTRNPYIVTAMEVLGYTENRYSGIPSIRQTMAEAHLPEPVFCDHRGIFSVCLYNTNNGDIPITSKHKRKSIDRKEFLAFCKVPRTRKEIAIFLGVSSIHYAMKRYVEPLILAGDILLSDPTHPKSSKQTYRAKS